MLDISGPQLNNYLGNPTTKDPALRQPNNSAANVAEVPFLNYGLALTLQPPSRSQNWAGLLCDQGEALSSLSLVFSFSVCRVVVVLIRKLLEDPERTLIAQLHKGYYVTVV